MRFFFFLFVSWSEYIAPIGSTIIAHFSVMKAFGGVFPTIALEDLEWVMRRDGVEKEGGLDGTGRGISEGHRTFRRTGWDYCQRK